MARSRDEQDRTRHRPRRIIVAILLGAAGLLGGAASLAVTMKARDPSMAHRLAPWDGRITAQVARDELAAETASASQRGATALSQKALRQDPTAVTAASTLGLVRSVRGEIAGARRLMHYAERLSRRDLATQIWAIEDAVSRDDIQEALDHYDIALRTSRQAPAILFPVLASAIGDADVRRSLVGRLATGPLWQGSFLDYASTTAPDPRATAQLFAMIGRPALPPSEGARAALLTRLVDTGAYDLAWRYYATLRPGVVPAASRDPRFTAGLATPLPFDWILGTNSGIAATFLDGRDASFDFAAPPSVGGTLLQQLQVLPTGRYRLLGHSRGIDEPSDTTPFWILSCRGSVELGRVTVPRSATAGGTFKGQFTVPANCPVQVLALVARPSSKVVGLSGQITDVVLRPIGQ